MAFCMKLKGRESDEATVGKWEGQTHLANQRQVVKVEAHEMPEEPLHPLPSGQAFFVARVGAAYYLAQTIGEKLP